jgi:hypothetical protein
VWVLLVVTLGCAPDSDGIQRRSRSTHDASPPAAHPAPRTIRETWDVHYIQDPKTGDPRKAGYRKTVEKEVIRSGTSRRLIEAVEHFRVTRFGEPTEVELKASSLETPKGEVLEFQYEIDMGSSPRRVQGKIADDRLHYQLTVGGRTQSETRSWSPMDRGFFAVEQSLRDDPMKPGQRRSVRTLLPMFDLVAEVELTAERLEATKLLSGTFELLRLHATTTFPDGRSVDSYLWMDPRGEILKATIDALKQETLRATKEIALDEDDILDFDLALNVIVPLDAPLDNPHATRRVEYEVTLADTDAGAVFASSDSQEVKPRSDGTAHIIVHAVRPGTPAPGDRKSRAPTDDDVQPNPLIQSDDPQVVEMSLAAAGQASDAWTAATALEKHVHQVLTRADFGQVLATAAEVVRTRRGDCTEHAVLLAALCRARGIPARVAIGLVYVERQGGFLYHMWNEAWINGRWIPLDATLGRGGIGAAHLKLADSSLKGESAYTSMLPVMAVVGKLKIEVLQAE